MSLQPSDDLPQDQPMIVVGTGEYPIFRYNLPARHWSISFGTYVLISDIRDLGYEIVDKTPKPAGDVVTELPPIKNADGTYTQAWDSRSFTAEEIAANLAQRKQELLAQVTQSMYETFKIGTSFDFGSTVGAKVFSFTDRDMARNLIFKELAATRISKGVTDLIELRTVAGENIKMSPAKTLEVVEALVEAYGATFAMNWALQDQIKAATTMAELPIVPVNLFNAAIAARAAAQTTA